MIIKRTPAVRSSEITDERDYLRRRDFLKAASGAALAAAAAARPGRPLRAAAAQEPLAPIAPSPLSTDERWNSFRDITSYNNFYEFGTEKEDPARHAGQLQTDPWTVRVEGHIGVPDADYAARGHPRAACARGARLPAALRRGVVDGGAVGRLSARRPHPAFRADVAGALRPLRDAVPAQRDARTAAADPAVAVRRGAADGRGAASADDPRGGPLRQDAAEPERRAAAPRRALEVRLQEHQVDRQDPVRREPAAHVVERDGPQRVRLLGERESARRPSALEPEERAPHRPLLPARRPACSTGTSTRSRACTPAWTCGATTRRPGRLPGPGIPCGC